MNATANLVEYESIKQDRQMESMSGNIINFNGLAHFDTDIEEIALVLSRLPIFNGHQLTHTPYSIAHHCLWVMRYVLWNTGSPKAALCALLYRAHEAYMGALPPQLKRLSYLYQGLLHIQDGIQHIVFQNLGLEPPLEETIASISNASRYAEVLEYEKFLLKKNSKTPLETIPEAAREIAWDHSDSAVIFEHFLESYEMLKGAIQSAEKLQ